MMKSCAFAILLIAISTPAFAQQQAAPPAATYTFTMTADEANLMFNQLGKLDWSAVNPLIQKLIAQLQEQQKAAQPPAAPPK